MHKNTNIQMLICYGDNDFRHLFSIMGRMLVAAIKFDEDLYDTIVENPIIIHDFIKLTLKLVGHHDEEVERLFKHLTNNSLWSNFMGSNPSKYYFGDEACERVLKNDFRFNDEALWIDLNEEPGYQII